MSPINTAEVFMAVVTIPKTGSTTPFPAASVEAKLRGALLESVQSTAGLHGIALPATTAGQYVASVHLDSLGVVDLVCEVEPIIGFELKDSIVKSGGYNSINEAITHVMPRIEAAWQKHASTGGKK
jgi:hypothetical protein